MRPYKSYQNKSYHNIFIANVLASILLFVLIVPDATATITISNPANNIKTTNQNPMFSWTKVSGASSYEFIISVLDDLTQPGLIKNQTQNYMQMSYAMTPGIWYYEVRAYDNNGSLIDKSNINKYELLEKPDFTIDVDLSNYNKNNEVLFTINAPLGSSVDLAITNDKGFYLPYSPSNLTTKTFRTFLSDKTNYNIEAELDYYGYTATYNNVFSTKSTETTHTKTAMPDKDRYVLDVIVKDTKLKKVIKGLKINARYFNKTLSEDDENNFKVVATNTTDENGVASFNLTEGKYQIEVVDDNYYDAKETITLDDNFIQAFDVLKLKYSKTENKSANINDAKNIQKTDKVTNKTTDTEAKDNIEQKDNTGKITSADIRIQEPKDNSVARDVLRVKFTSKDVFKSCAATIMVRDSDKVLYRKEFNDTDEIMFNNISVGDYELKIRCRIKDGINASFKEITSDPVYFKMAQGYKEEDLISDKLETLHKKMLNLDTLGAEEKEVADILHISSQIANNIQKINDINEQYKKDIQNAINNDESDKQLDKIKKDALEQINKIYDSMPAKLTIRKSSSAVLRSEVDEDSLYLFIQSQKLNFTKRQERAMLKSRPVIFDMNVEVVEIKTVDDKYVTKTIVTKKIDLTGDFVMIESIPKIAEFSTSNIIIPVIDVKHNSKFISIDNDKFAFEISAKENPKIIYMIDKNININNVELMHTTIVKTNASDSGMGSISGFASYIPRLSTGSILGGFIVFFSVVITIFLVLPNVNLSGAIRPKVSESTMSFVKQANLIFDLYDNNKHEKALKKYPSALKMYEQLTPARQEEFKEIMQHLEQELNIHHINIMIEKTNKLLETQKMMKNKGNMNAVDKLYKLVLDNYSKILSVNAELDPLGKAKVKNNIDDLKTKLTRVELT